MAGVPVGLDARQRVPAAAYQPVQKL